MADEVRASAAALSQEISDTLEPRSSSDSDIARIVELGSRLGRGNPIRVKFKSGALHEGIPLSYTVGYEMDWTAEHHQFCYRGRVTLLTSGGREVQFSLHDVAAVEPAPDLAPRMRELARARALVAAGVL